MTTATLSAEFKITEIGPLPQEWQTATLGDLFDFKQGKALSPDSRRGISPKAFLRTANVLWGRLDLGVIDQMDFDKGESGRLALVPGDLLVCEGGDTGRTAIWRGELAECYYQNHIHRLRAKSGDTFPEFYMYWMQAALLLLKLYVGQANRTTIPNLSTARLKCFVVPVPSVSEQKKIAAVLSAVQEAKEKTEAVIRAARELKKSLMKQLFTYGPVSLEGAPKVSLKETEIGPVPEGWEVTRLGALCQRVPQVDPTKNPDTKFQYIDVSSISRETLRIINHAEYDGREAPSRARKPIKQDDVIFATVRPYLKRVALVPRRFDGDVCSTAFSVARANPALADPKYLFYAVSRDCFVERVSEHQTGSSYPAITDKDVLNELIPQPPQPIQRKIARMLSSLDDKIEAEQTKMKVLDALFKTLLANLMTGKIRVNQPESSR